MGEGWLGGDEVEVLGVVLLRVEVELGEALLSRLQGEGVFQVAGDEVLELREVELVEVVRGGRIHPDEQPEIGEEGEVVNVLVEDVQCLCFLHDLTEDLPVGGVGLQELEVLVLALQAVEESSPQAGNPEAVEQLHDAEHC